MARSSDTGIHYHRHVALLDDDAQEVAGLQSLVRTDGGSQRHHRSGSGFFQTLAEGRVGLAVGQYHETEFHEFFRSLQGLGRVGQQVARVGMDFQFQPVGAEGFAGHLCGEHGFFCGTHAGGVRKELDMRVDDMFQHVVFLVLKLDAFHGDGHHLGAGSENGFFHDLVGVEFSCSQEQAGVEFFSRNH